jgi:hypothetical protein
MAFVSSLKFTDHIHSEIISIQLPRPTGFYWKRAISFAERNCVISIQANVRDRNFLVWFGKSE